MKKIIIIGGVAAGMSAAAKAKRLNPELEIVVYEKTDIVSWGACGLPYYVGDFYQDANIMIAREPEQFAKDGIVVKSLHEVIDIDITKKEVLVLNKKTGEKFYDSYDEVIVTTGASAIRPNIKNIDSENIFNLKDFRDGIELKKAMLKEENKKVIIIGAGYIGLEAGEAARHLNKEVKIIQLSSRVLPGSFDKEITDLMEEELNNTENLDLHLEESVEEFIAKDGKVVRVKTNKGEYPADIVIVAIGVKPNTEFLKDKGFNMLRNGALIIDSKGRTNVEGVYAAGDCASVYHKVRKENVYIPLATTANKIQIAAKLNSPLKENIILNPPRSPLSAVTPLAIQDFFTYFSLPITVKPPLIESPFLIQSSTSPGIYISVQEPNLIIPYSSPFFT